LKGEGKRGKQKKGNRMKVNRPLKAVLCCVVVGVLSGCAMFNKGTMHYSRTTTIGQELVDLMTARNKGVLTDEEYSKLKKEIMAGGPLQMEEK
jgi:hypothetical protein